MPDVYFFAEGGHGAAEEMKQKARELGPACLPDVLWVLEHGWTQMRCAALECLVHLAPNRVEEHALPILQHEADREVRETAARVLAHGSGEDAARALLALRAAVRTAYDALSQRPHCTPVILQELARVPNDPHLVELLGARCDEPARAWLEAAIDRRDPRIMHAVDALTDGTTHEAARAALLRRIVLVGGEPRDAAALGLLRRKAAGTTPAAELARGSRHPKLVETAVRLLFEGDAARAFDVGSSFLEAHDGNFDRQRIVWAQIESLLDTPNRLDPRWRDACLACDATDSIAEYATEVRAAFEWMADPPPPVAFTAVELPETEDDPLGAPYPLVVAGFPLPDGMALPDPAAWSPLLYVVEHQYAGTACAHARWVGFLVQLTPTLREALRSSVEAVSGRHDGALTSRQIDPIRTALRAELVEVPRLEGHEALLVSAPCQPVRALAGLSVVELKANVRPWRGVVFYGDQWPEAVPVEAYGAHHDAELRRLSTLLGGGNLRLALLWSNSD